MLTLLRKAHVFAPDDLGVQDVLIARDRIAAIGNDLPGLPSTLEHREVDLSGHMLIPGLIDAHVHVTGGGGEAGPETRVPPIQLTHLSEAGVTSCVGVLGTDGTTRTVRDLVATTMGLRALGLSAWCYTGSYQIPPPTLTGSVRDDIVYVDPIIGIGELALSDHRSSQPTLDEFLRVASDAYVAGMIANKAGVVHCHMGSGERGFKLLHEALDIAEIPPRVYHPTHINRERWLFEEAKSLAERGVTCDVTAFPDDGETMLAAEAIMRWRKEGGAMERLTVSSDGAGCLPNFDEGGRLVSMDVGRPKTLIDAIKTLIAEGEPLDEVLPVFTSNVARLLALPRKGRLRVDADADIAVLSADGSLRYLWAMGQLMVEHGQPRQFGHFETR